MPDLTDTDRAILDAWSRSWIYPGVRDSRLAEVTGLSATRQHARLNQLIDTEAALAYAPLTVKRLRRVRALRQRSRHRSA